MVIVSNNVLILARTRMNNNHVCVGGYDLDSRRYVRLLTNTAENQDENSPYQVRQIYSMEYENRQNLVLPHCEDVCVQQSTMQRTLTRQELNDELGKLAAKNIHIRDLFGGLLHWENGKGYLLQTNNMPPHSVMVACLNHDLFLYEERRFRYLDNGKVFSVKYVGTNNLHLRKISQGTFVRFSLARWWDKNHTYPVKRAYLQLSTVF